MWYTPAEHNRFTGEPNTRTTRRMTGGESAATSGVVIRPTTRVVGTTIASSATAAPAITETGAENGGVGTMTGGAGTTTRSRHGMTTGVKRLSDRPRTRRTTTTKTRATGILITGMTGGIVIATGASETDRVGTAAATGSGIGGTPGTTGRRAVDTNVRVTRTKIAERDRGRVREIAHHRRRSER